MFSFLRGWLVCSLSGQRSTSSKVDDEGDEETTRQNGDGDYMAGASNREAMVNVVLSSMYEKYSCVWNLHHYNSFRALELQCTETETGKASLRLNLGKMTKVVVDETLLDTALSAWKWQVHSCGHRE